MSKRDACTTSCRLGKLRPKRQLRQVLVRPIALSHERDRPLFQHWLIGGNLRRQILRPLANADQPLAGLPCSYG